MPGVGGLEVLTTAREQGCATPIVVITAASTMNNAIEALKRGARDYLTKPFENLDLVVTTAARAAETAAQASELERVKKELDRKLVGGEIIGHSAAIQEVYKLIGRVVSNDKIDVVLVSGESGTGKELVARAIHFKGAPARAFHPGQLLGHPARPGRERAVRPRARRVHRRGRAARGQVRGRRRGHAVPRRDRRSAAGVAAQAVARAPGARVHPGRRRGDSAPAGPHHRGHQPGPRNGGRRAPFSRGSLFPPARHPDPPAAAAPAPRGHPRADRFLRRQGGQRNGLARDRSQLRGARETAGLRLARQRARAGEHGAAGGAARLRQHHPRRRHLALRAVPRPPPPPMWKATPPTPSPRSSDGGSRSIWRNPTAKSRAGFTRSWWPRSNARSSSRRCAGPRATRCAPRGSSGSTAIRCAKSLSTSESQPASCPFD